MAPQTVKIPTMTMQIFELTAQVDRPVGYQDAYGTRYPLNYGYVPGVIAGDGEEQDVYLLFERAPLTEFSGQVIAIIHRHDDVEDKWVAVKKDDPRRPTKDEIWQQVRFIEQYFDSEIELLD